MHWGKVYNPSATSPTSSKKKIIVLFFTKRKQNAHLRENKNKKHEKHSIMILMNILLKV